MTPGSRLVASLCLLRRDAENTSLQKRGPGWIPNTGGKLLQKHRHQKATRPSLFTPFPSRLYFSAKIPEKLLQREVRRMVRLVPWENGKRRDFWVRYR